MLRTAREDPGGFIAALPARVTRDEVQRAPGLLLAIKTSVDSDRRPGRFLLTGSANLLLLPKVGDSLARKRRRGRAMSISAKSIRAQALWSATRVTCSKQ